MRVETAITKIKDPVERLFAFARARHQIHLDRQDSKKPPWTDDPILRDYRFCNIYREDDRVTRWIRERWRQPHETERDLWFAMCVARLHNQPEALEVIGFPVPWRQSSYLEAAHSVKKRGLRLFNAAYVVVAPTKPKELYLAREVLTPLWDARERLRPRVGDTLCGFHVVLGQMQGFGSFMTAQVIADVKYHAPLSEAPDWWTFAASGPGSRRGLNYVLGRSRESPWVEDDWRLELGRLRERLFPMFAGANMPKPHAQDVQNLLCEWNKYAAMAYEGRKLKQRYRWQGK